MEDQPETLGLPVDATLVESKRRDGHRLEGTGHLAWLQVGATARRSGPCALHGLRPPATPP